MVLRFQKLTATVRKYFAFAEPVGLRYCLVHGVKNASKPWGQYGKKVISMCNWQTHTHVYVHLYAHTYMT